MPQTKEQKTILHVYAALTVSIVLGFVPTVSGAILCALMFLGAWFAAYAIRSKAETDGLVTNHMTFIIRTLWISGLIGFVSMGAASFYILSVYDSSISVCANAVINNGIVDMESIMQTMAPCMQPFIIGTMIGAGPIVVYLGYRLAKGVSRAVKAHRIGNVKNWF